MDKVIAFIHAKGTSVRVPGKNIRELGDMPLFCHALFNAQKCTWVDRVVIDSDDEHILNVGAELGATPLDRPRFLATNDATGDHLAYWQATNYPDSEVVVQVVPTSPFIKPESIGNAIRMLMDNAVNSVVGCRSEALYKWWNGQPDYIERGRIPNSFELEPTVYETTGLYVNRTKFVLAEHKRVDENNCMPYLLSKIEAIDINTEEDFEFAEIVWRGIHGHYIFVQARKNDME